MPVRQSAPTSPRFIQPQLSQLVAKPPEGDRWCPELKLDGYRLHARIVGKEVKLLTRTGLDWTHKYGATARALAALRVKSAYIDGELCALRMDGTTSFSDLQASIDRKRTDDLVYFAFDLLFLDGRNLSAAPLQERKQLLAELLDRAPPAVRYTEHVIGDGAAFHAAACAHKIEGIVSKQLDAPYKPGERGTWRKTKCMNGEEFVIAARRLALRSLEFLRRGFQNAHPHQFQKERLWRAALSNGSTVKKVSVLFSLTTAARMCLYTSPRWSAPASAD